MINKQLSGILIFALILFAAGCKSTQKAGGRSTSDAGKVQKSESKDNTAVFIEASKNKLTGNYEEAVELFKKCLILDPSDAASMYELAGLMLITNETAEALSYASKAAAISPENTWYQLLYAQVLKKTGKYDEAVKVYEKLYNNHPANLDYGNQLAIAHVYAGDLDEAIKVYDRMEEQIGITEEISLKKQSIYLQDNRLDDAIREIEKLIGAYPDEPRYYAILAEMCLSGGKDQKALEAYDKILEIDPLNPYVHISLADYYRSKGDTGRAFEELKQGFSNPNLDIETKIQIIITYYSDAGDIVNIFDEAFELARILVETHPESPEAYSVYGDFLAQEDRHEEARNAFRKVISIDSSRYLYWEQLLLVEAELNDSDAILNESSRALELFPEQPLLYLLKGSALYMKKEWNECIDVLNKGLLFVIDNKLMTLQFHTYLGDAYYQTDNYTKSDESYEKVLSLDPDNDYVLNNYAYYLSLRNENLERAAEMAKRATELKPGTSSNQDTYGWVLYKMGYYNDAETWIRKAIDSGGENNAVILEHYGDVLFKLGRTDEAYEYWQKASEAGKGSDLLEKKLTDKTLYE